MGDHDATEPVPLSFSREELVLVNNALNEVCNGIHFSDDEFHTRLGSARQETLDVLRRIAEALGREPA